MRSLFAIADGPKKQLVELEPGRYMEVPFSANYLTQNRYLSWIWWVKKPKERKKVCGQCGSTFIEWGLCGTIPVCNLNLLRGFIAVSEPSLKFYHKGCLWELYDKVEVKK